MVTIRISRVPRSDGYRYFWGKTVDGFDPSTCCMPSLVGRQLRRVRLDAPADADIELETGASSYVYLCGSNGPYRTNLHLAMALDPGSSFEEVSSSGLVVQVRGARRLEIPAIAEPVGRFSVRQLRCRNFRFGYSVFGQAVAAL